jgi:nucleotide-binding universal stress UspA family protein
MENCSPPGAVMVGVDGSVGSDTAVAWAAAYAQDHQRPLRIVHAAVPPVLTDYTVDLAASEEDLREAGSVITLRASGLARASHPSVPVTCSTTIGDPRTVLTRLGADASLLVLGSRGRSAVASLLLGSVGVAVTAHAPCPVVVARQRTRSVAPADLAVVVGIDGSESSAGALAFAFELASAQYRPLRVVHALGRSAMFSYPETVSPELVQETTAASARLLADSLAGYSEKFPDVVVHHLQVWDSPTQALVDASATASTVVVGCRGRGVVQNRLLGSVSRSVVEHAHCTVAVIRGGRT